MEEKNNKNSANATVESLLKGMENYLTTKTVVGEPIHLNDTVILPLCDVSFGVGAGAWSGEKKSNGGGGMGGKINPSAVLVIQDGTARMVGIGGEEDKWSKIMNMVPDVVNRLVKKVMPQTETQEEEVSEDFSEESTEK